MKAGKALHIILAILAVLYLTGHILLNNKTIQQKAASHVIKIARSALGTDVTAGRIQFVYPFGITIDNLTIYDLESDTLAHVASASLRFKPLQLIKKKISITSVRINSPDIRLYADSIGTEPNYGFITSLFSGGGNSSPMTFRANSVLIRNGSIRYDIKSAETTDSLFNPNHIGINGLVANLSLKSISNDSIAFIVRKLSLAEQSGFKLSKAKGALTIGKGFTHLIKFMLLTPRSSFEIAELKAYTGLAHKHEGIPDFETSLNASVTGADFKAFIPQLYGMTDCIDLSLNCYSQDRILHLNSLNTRNRNSSLDMSGSGTILTGTSPLVEGCRHLKADISFSKTLPEWIETQLTGFGITLPRQCHGIGDGVAEMMLTSESGKVDSHVSLICNAGNATGQIVGSDGVYQATLEGHDILLNDIMDNEYLGRCDFTAGANITESNGSFSGSFNSNLGLLQYKQYDYRNIAVTGRIEPEMILSDLRFSDNNGSIALDARLDKGRNKSFLMDLKAEDIDLYAYNISGNDSMSLSAGVHANLTGETIDDLTGKITINGLDYSDAHGHWEMENLTASIGSISENNKVISVFSDFMNISLVGDYRISSLGSSIANVCGVILPTIGHLTENRLGLMEKTRENPNSFVVNARIDRTDFMDKVFHKPVSLDYPATMQLSVNDASNSCYGTVSVPGISISGEHLDNLLITLNSADSTCRTRISALFGEKENGQTEITASLLAFEDIIRGQYSWKNQDGSTQGTAKSLSQFFDYSPENGLNSMTLIDSTKVKVNGTEWKFAITDIRTAMNKVHISGFNISNDKQYIYLDGTASPDSSDVLKISVRKIDLGHTLSMLHKNNLELNGIASGNILFTGLTGNPTFDGSFDIDGLDFSGSYLGDMHADCHWNKQAERVEVYAMSIAGYSSTGFTGYFIPDRKYISVDIEANNTDLTFLNIWTGSVFKELGGLATGNLHIFGYLPDMDLEGEAILDNGRFVQSAINSTFTVEHDTLWFEPGRMLFRNVDFKDGEGHKGVLTCILSHDHFSDWRVNMTADMDGMLVYNQPKTEKSSFNARVYAKGKMKLTSTPENGLSVNVDAKTAQGTRLGFQPSSGSVADYNFLTIVDRNSVNIYQDEVKSIIPDFSDKSDSRYNLNLNIECSEDAYIDMSISSLTGLFRGNGNISVKLDSKDGLILNGLYNLKRGECSLSIEDLIRKKFSLIDGSYVRFNGSLMDTELNLLTSHTVNSASIYDLDPSSKSSSKPHVRCLLGVTGNVTEPKLSFDVDMPSGTPEEKAILASALATEEQRNLQFIYLLAIGRFYTYDYNTAVNEGITPSAMESIVNSTVSGQINNILSQVLDNDKVSISSNLSASSYLSNDASNLSNKELEGILEAHLLNNRLLVNGNFGYRENTINNTSNFIGDFEFKYLLLPDKQGKGISIKGYSKNNDKYFSKASLTTQGVGLVFEKDF